MKIDRWGDSLAVRIPPDVAEALGLKEGDEVEVAAAVPTGTAKDPAERAAAIATLRSLRGLVPAGFRFDRDEANARR
ncbi:AbrB family transcriptional regulator [Sphingomonas sp. Leaf412]|uniref:AbrB/MazE/SpoVT family DNA-binding domain-containing protein n=1 Tax=Sphingomonas sp. Leaf412 TaxID=1736370 RepID=UPI0006F86355|nr:AbrB/MazE/SpoVT family DNA-binding domain-containing protein [Sphingomonas sp. Leaf412]KQT31842.1 AbrB family transcriptional regulator [Sphingomonas sp. Leaf412]